MKYYKFRMKLNVMNYIAVILFVPLFISLSMLKLFGGVNVFFLVYYFLWMFLHEFLHGIGFYLFGGKNVCYGVCLEKGIMYCLCKDKVSKNCIMTSLIFPFFFIGVCTFHLGLYLDNSTLVLLSLFNIIGSVGDLLMYFFFLRLPDFSYVDIGECDSFVLISSSDLSSYKSIGFELVSVDSKVEGVDCKRISISTFSWVVMIIIFALFYLSFWFL